MPRRTEAVAGHAAFSPDGGLLVVPSTRASLQVVDTRTFLPLFELAIPDGSSTCEPVCSPDGTRLAIASVHRQAFVWDLRRARIEQHRIGLDWTDARLPPPTGGTVLAMVVHR